MMSTLDRREFSLALAAGLSAGWPAAARSTSEEAGMGKGSGAGGVTDVPGVRVGLADRSFCGSSGPDLEWRPCR